jgi:hypothetical protein
MTHVPRKKKRKSVSVFRLRKRIPNGRSSSIRIRIAEPEQVEAVADLTAVEADLTEEITEVLQVQADAMINRSTKKKYRKKSGKLRPSLLVQAEEERA